MTAEVRKMGASESECMSRAQVTTSSRVRTCGDGAEQRSVARCSMLSTQRSAAQQLKRGGAAFARLTFAHQQCMHLVAER